MLCEMSRGSSEMSRTERTASGLRCDQTALRGIAADEPFHFGEPGVDGHEALSCARGLRRGKSRVVSPMSSPVVIRLPTRNKVSLAYRHGGGGLGIKGCAVFIEEA